MNQNTISVVIPMYNAAATILQTIESVYAQTWKGVIEIIVVNDGSKDNSKVLVEEYMSKHGRENLILLNQENAGVSSARNAGMQRSSGDWICLLDSDDVWLPHKLERQLAVLDSDPSIAFLGTTRNGEYIKRLGFRRLGKINLISPK